MSIYEGTHIEQAYAQGLNRGRRNAEWDLRNSVPASIELADLTEQAEFTLTREVRALVLGELRGYREIARTLLNGRWGT